MYVCLNGAILAADEAKIKVTNRAFRYGDGLFETIRMFDGRAIFFDLHWQRLQDGMTQLGFDSPPNFREQLTEGISKLTENQGNYRIRIQVWRADGGLYRPSDHQPQFLIETSPLDSSVFQIPELGLKLDIHEGLHPPSGQLAGLKTTAALPYILAANYAHNRGLDDLLLTNPDGSIADGSRGNIFIVLNNGNIATPLDFQCGIHGTMRRLVLLFCQENDIVIAPKITSYEIHLAGVEAFLTNAISGVLPIESIGNTRFWQNSTTLLLVDWLNKQRANALLAR